MNFKLSNLMKAAAAAAGMLASATVFSQTGPIKIGVVTPLSGTYAGIGQQVKWGLDLAAAQINAAGGVMGRRLELIYEDEEANPAVAVQKAEKLLQVSRWTSSPVPSTPALPWPWDRWPSAMVV